MPKAVDKERSASERGATQGSDTSSSSGPCADRNAVQPLHTLHVTHCTHTHTLHTHTHTLHTRCTHTECTHTHIAHTHCTHTLHTHSAHTQCTHTHIAHKQKTTTGCTENFTAKDHMAKQGREGSSTDAHHRLIGLYMYICNPRQRIVTD